MASASSLIREEGARHPSPCCHRRIVLLFLALVLTASAGATTAGRAFAADAPGWFEGHSEEEKQAIVNWAYRGGPQGVVPYPGTPSATADEMYAGEKREADGVNSARLGWQAYSARTVPKILPKVIDVVGKAGLGLFVFDFGFQIGTYANGKFLHIGLPRPTPYVGYAGDQYLWRANANEYYWGAVTPSRGWLLGYDNGRKNFYLDLAQQDAGCDPYGITQAPEGFTWLPGSVTRCTVGSKYHSPPIEGHVGVFFIGENDLRPTGPIKEFDPATDHPDFTSPAPAAPDPATARSALAGALNTAGEEVARGWLDYSLDPNADPSGDPVEAGVATQEDRNERCRLSSPNPDPDALTDAWTEKMRFQRRLPNGDLVSTPLRWGNELQPTQPKWKGWGYRKIAQKHGWHPIDLDETAAALLTVPKTFDKYGGKEYEYTGAHYTPSGTNYDCARRVIVRTYIRPETEPLARQIVTSYGRYMGTL